MQQEVSVGRSGAHLAGAQAHQGPGQELDTRAQGGGADEEKKHEKKNMKKKT